MTALERSMAEHRSFLWGLCYRMTGVAADADDLVQETFARALGSPPARNDAPLRPWLTRIALNAARDALRRRRRSHYEGPWLPSPIDTEEEPPSFEPSLEGRSTEGRYELLESVSYAFLMALEALTPQQRAVLLLREVFDYSVEETAEALSLSAANVKVTHHRARKRMAAFDRDRLPTDGASAIERNRAVLGALMQALIAQDPAAVEALLAEDVVMLNDGAGEFHAAKVPVFGVARVATFLLRIQAMRGAPRAAELRMLNGMPALVATWANPRAGDSPSAVFRVELDGAGRIREVHSVLATRKLACVRLPAA